MLWGVTEVTALVIAAKISIFFLYHTCYEEKNGKNFVKFSRVVLKLTIMVSTDCCCVQTVI